MQTLNSGYATINEKKKTETEYNSTLNFTFRQTASNIEIILLLFNSLMQEVITLMAKWSLLILIKIHK